MVAGNETTTKLLGNAWYWGWRNPDQRAKPFADPARVPDWVEETLRYDTSTQMLVRVTSQPVRVQDVDIEAGRRILLLLGSANRDEGVFPDPERYDLERRTQDLVSFGSGRHFCMGAALARMEARVALTEVRARSKDYEVDPAESRGCIPSTCGASPRCRPRSRRADAATSSPTPKGGRRR